MRIIAGQFRGRKLAAVGKGDIDAHLRPTTDRVRESLFNVLSHLDVIPGARVLDLFAGTGALGLEALSRGADHVTFVENGRAAQALISKNIDLISSADRTCLIRRDARRLGVWTQTPFDLVFLDPPYGQGLGTPVLSSVRDAGWLAADAFVVWEENQPMSPPPGFTLEDNRRFGDTHIALMRTLSDA